MCIVISEKSIEMINAFFTLRSSVIPQRNAVLQSHLPLAAVPPSYFWAIAILTNANRLVMRRMYRVDGLNLKRHISNLLIGRILYGFRVW